MNPKSISHCQVKGSLSHNNRVFKPKNVDSTRTQDNMNLKNKFNVKRIVSGLLASIMLSQVFIYGDGTCKGILHTDNIKAMATESNNFLSNQIDYENNITISSYVSLKV